MGRELINPPKLHPAPGFSHIAGVTSLALPELLIEIECTVAID